MNRFFFPHIKNRIYFENAGGTQIPGHVLNYSNFFLTNNFVQPYGLSKSSLNLNKIITESKEITNILINNNNYGKVFYGSSASQLAFNFCNSINLNEDSNIVLTNMSHESAIGPFERMKHNKKFWNIKSNNSNGKFFIDYDKLYENIDKNTELVVIPHASNVMGNILDVENISKEIKKINSNAKLYVDGVAYFPHHIVDVSNIDFYVISYYKFMGLRISSLFVKNQHIDLLNKLNHIFLNDDESKLQIGGIQYEQMSCIPGIKNYMLDTMNGRCNKLSRDTCIQNYNLYSDHENKLMKYFDTKIKKFNKYNDLNILTDYSKAKIPVYSLYSKKINIDNLCIFLNQNKVECKTGKFYCDRLLNTNNIDKVLRISLFHYNTIDEIDYFFDLLEEFNQKYETKKINFNYFNNNYSNYVKNTFNYLKVDPYYSNKRYRAVSLIDIDNKKIIGNTFFLQSSEYNSYLGDKLRTYENIDSNLLKDDSFIFMINEIQKQLTSSGKKYKYLYLHQMRVEVDNDDINPVPEGIHQDGFNYICLSCVNKYNIETPINELLNLNKENILSIKLDSGGSLIINDRKFYHNVGKLKLKNKKNKGYRDIFVFTTVC